MKLIHLQAKLLTSAKKIAPSDAVPYAFEKRIMAGIATPVVDLWAVWSHALLRAAAMCVALMLLIGAWAWHSTTPDNTTDVAQIFEDTVFVDSDEQIEDSW